MIMSLFVARLQQTGCVHRTAPHRIEVLTFCFRSHVRSDCCCAFVVVVVCCCIYVVLCSVLLFQRPGHRANGVVVERIQHMLMRVAIGIHQVRLHSHPPSHTRTRLRFYRRCGLFPPLESESVWQQVAGRHWSGAYKRDPKVFFRLCCDEIPKIL